jgi:hypothetical protein
MRPTFWWCVRLAYQHHPFPYLGPPYSLQREPTRLISSTRSARLQPAVTYDTLCPASPLLTDARFRWMVFTAVGMNCPTESGPRSTGSLAEIRSVG